MNRAHHSDSGLFLCVLVFDLKIACIRSQFLLYLITSYYFLLTALVTKPNLYGRKKEEKCEEYIGIFFLS